MGSSTDTRNFGFRRFTNIVREGRLRSPASGTTLRIGTFVEQDPNDPDRIREATVTAIGGGGDVRLNKCGILLYEHDSQTYNDPRFGAAANQLVQDLWWVPNNRMVQVISGPGVKVWFRNTAAETTEPGLNFPNTREEVTMVSGIGIATPTVAVGDLLGWDDSNDFYTVTANAAEAFMRVTALYNDTATVDAEILV
jgi:hypothetical protein